MIYFKACPRCKGDVQFENAIGDAPDTLTCIACGWNIYRRKRDVVPDLRAAVGCPGHFAASGSMFVSPNSGQRFGRCRECGAMRPAGIGGGISWHVPIIGKRNVRNMLERGDVSKVLDESD
jgi:hypothetical protein